MLNSNITPIKIGLYTFVLTLLVSSCSNLNRKPSVTTNRTNTTTSRTNTTASRTNTTTSRTNRRVSSTMRAENKLRSDLIQYAQKFKGVKYKYAGKNPQGFDCSGFTHYVCKKYAIPLSGSSASQSKQGKEISISKAKKGDLLFFGRHGRNGKIQHVGMVYSNDSKGLYMIHASSSRGIVVDNVTTSTYWKPKLLFARRVLDLKNN